jgi:chymotrypsin
MKLAILCALVAAVAAFPAPEKIDWSADVVPIEEHPEFLARYPIYKTLFPEGQASGSNRIVGGENATPHQFPYQCALLLQMTGGLALCGGSIISPVSYILFSI